MHEPFDATTLKKMEIYRSQNLTGDAQLLPIGHQTVAKRAILNAYTDGKLKPKTKTEKVKPKEKKPDKIRTKFKTEGGPTKKKKEKSTQKKDKEKTSRKEGARTGESPELSGSKRQKMLDRMDAQGLQALMRAAKGMFCQTDGRLCKI